MNRAKYLSAVAFVLAMLLFQRTVFGQNTLTKSEKNKGWVMLFDGTSIDKWRGYNDDAVPPEWKAANGVLEFTPAANDSTHQAKDLVTKEVYQDFELSLEWKISKNGNSGILYNVVEDPKFEAPYMTGPEMQVVDNIGGELHIVPKHKAGDLYDLVSSRSNAAKPVGEWNHAYIISKRGHYQFFLNDVKIVEYEMHTPVWDELVANSKFKNWADFGKADRGKICLQAHGSQVFYRNIKIHSYRLRMQ